MKLCQTPGCTLPDFHSGAHSFECCLVIRKTRVERTKVARPGNQFQHDISFARSCVEEQAGTKLVLPPDLHGEKRQTNVEATLISSLQSGPQVACARTKKGTFVHLTSADLARSDVGVEWNLPTEQILNDHMICLVSEGHDASNRRMDLFVKTLREKCKTEKSQLVLTLDGNGANREAYVKAFEDDERSMPRCRTFEIDPDVALCQQILYGRGAVTYTGAMFEEKFGYGCAGSPTSPPGIEYLITNRKNSKGVPNLLFTKEDAERTVGLNLDYCGGPIGGKNYEEGKKWLSSLLSRLPNLVVLCVTIGKRQRRGLLHNFELYVPDPYGFSVVHTFGAKEDNSRVVSRLYARCFAVPRVLSVPGSMWSYNGAKDRSSVVRNRTWLCVVKSATMDGGILLYCVEDDTDDHHFKKVFPIPRGWVTEDISDGAAALDQLRRRREEVSRLFSSELRKIDAQIECLA